MLAFKDVSVRQGDSVVLEEISFTVSPGAVVAVHCGVKIREVLFALLSGEHAAYTGEIAVCGQRPDRHDLQYREKLSLLSIHDGIYHRLTVEEALKFYHSLYHPGVSVDEVIRLLQLTTFRRKKLGRLSLSIIRRVQYAAMLLHTGELFVLEEPDQNVDHETRHLFALVLSELQKRNKAVLLLTSNMESALFVTSTVYRVDHHQIRLLDVQPEESEEEKEDKEISRETISEVMHVRFEKIPTKVNEKIVLLDPPEIDYIESQDGQSVLHSSGETFPSVFTMNELEERLHAYGFFRCHRSYIVNLQRVREVITYTKNSFSLVLDDKEKTTIPLSKTKMAELKTMIGLK